MPCSAQRGDTMNLQFMTFPMSMKPLPVELLVGEGETIKLEVPSNEVGPVVNVPRMPSLVLGESVLDENDKPIFDERGKPLFKVYGQGVPLGAPKQLVLLLRKGRDMSAGFDVRVISSDVKKFGGGKILFLNAAMIDIGGNVGGVKFAIKPGQQTVIKPKLGDNGRLAFVEFFYERKGKAVPFFSSMWPVAEQYRGLVFFYHNPKNKNKITLHTYRDFLGAVD